MARKKKTLAEKLEDPTFKKYYLENRKKKREKPKETVAFLGPKFSFSYDAALEYNPDSELIPQQSIIEVFNAVAEERAETGIVPFQNIKGGEVIVTLESLLKYRQNYQINIVNSLMFNINMAIGGLGDPENVERIVSYSKGFEQCAEYLANNYPGADLIEVKSTADGPVRIRNGEFKNAAALASPNAFNAVDIPIWQEYVGDVKPNKTEFLLIQKGKTASPTGKRKKNRTTIAVIQTHRNPNYMLNALNLFRKNSVEVLEQFKRQIGTGLDKHFYHLGGHPEKDQNLVTVIESLENDLPFAGRVKVENLGSYRYEDFFPKKIINVGLIGGNKNRVDVLRQIFESSGYTVTSYLDELEGSNKNRGLTQEVLQSYRACAKKSNAIIIQPYQLELKEEEKIVRAIAPYIHNERLVVMSGKIQDGKEEIYRAWIRDQVYTEILDEVNHQEQSIDTKSPLKNFVRTYKNNIITEHEEKNSNEELATKLTDIHCGAVEYLGMNLLVKSSESDLSGKNIIFTYEPDVDQHNKAREFMEIFYGTGMAVTETTPKDHDIKTGYAKNLPTIMTRIAAGALPDDSTLSELCKFGSPDSVAVMQGMMSLLLNHNLDAHVQSLINFPNRQQYLQDLFEVARDTNVIGAQTNTGNRYHSALQKLADKEKQ